MRRTVQPPLAVEHPDAALYPDEVAEAAHRLEVSGLLPTRDDGVCCYADQSKVWVDGPDGKPWEIYAVLADVDEPARTAPCC